jgi:hypothetical protein
MLFAAPSTLSGLAALTNLPKAAFLLAFVGGVVISLVPLALAFRSPNASGSPQPEGMIRESLSDSVKGLLLLWPLGAFCGLVGGYATYTSFSGETKAMIVWDFVMAFLLIAAGMPAYYWIWRRQWVKQEGSTLELGTELGTYRRIDSIPLEKIEGLVMMRAEKGLFTVWYVSVNVREESAPRRLVETPYLDEAEEASKRLESLLKKSGKKVPVTKSA